MSGTLSYFPCPVIQLRLTKKNNITTAVANNATVIFTHKGFDVINLNTLSYYELKVIGYEINVIVELLNLKLKIHNS